MSKTGSILLAALALAGCGPSLQQRYEQRMAAAAAAGQGATSVRETASGLVLERWSWRSENDHAYGSFTIANNGAQPQDDIWMLCELFVPVRGAVGGGYTEPAIVRAYGKVSPGTSRTYDKVLISAHTSAESRITCRITS